MLMTCGRDTLLLLIVSDDLRWIHFPVRKASIILKIDSAGNLGDQTVGNSSQARLRATTTTERDQLVSCNTLTLIPSVDEK